jgi:hypothetical protein
VIKKCRGFLFHFDRGGINSCFIYPTKKTFPSRLCIQFQTQNYQQNVLSNLYDADDTVNITSNITISSSYSTTTKAKRPYDSFLSCRGTDNILEEHILRSLIPPYSFVPFSIYRKQSQFDFKVTFFVIKNRRFRLQQLRSRDYKAFEAYCKQFGLVAPTTFEECVGGVPTSEEETNPPPSAEVLKEVQQSLPRSPPPVYFNNIYLPPQANNSTTAVMAPISSKQNYGQMIGGDKGMLSTIVLIELQQNGNTDLFHFSSYYCARL